MKKTIPIADHHILEAMTAHLRGLSVLDDNQEVTGIIPSDDDETITYLTVENTHD